MRPGWRLGRGRRYAEARGTCWCWREPPLRPCFGAEGQGQQGCPGSRKIEAAQPTPVSVPGLEMGGGQRANRTAGVVGVGMESRAGSDLGQPERSRGREGQAYGERDRGLSWSQSQPTDCVGSPRPVLSPALGRAQQSLTRRLQDSSSCLSWLSPWVQAAPTVAQAPSKHARGQGAYYGCFYRLGRRPSLKLAGSHSFLLHFRQAGSRFGPGPSQPEPHRPHPTPVL